MHRLISAVFCLMTALPLYAQDRATDVGTIVPTAAIITIQTDHGIPIQVTPPGYDLITTEEGVALPVVSQGYHLDTTAEGVQIAVPNNTPGTPGAQRR